MDLGDIRLGTAIDLDGQSFLVVAAQHTKMGRGGAVLKAKLRNLRTGAVIDRTIKPGDTFTEAEVDRSPATFLYADPSNLTFMDKKSYDQFTLPRANLSGQEKYLVDGTDVDVLSVNQQPVSLDLPIKMVFTVKETPPNVKGNTAQGGNKPATLETGAIVSVPLFIKPGDKIRVKTTDGTYVERV